MKTREKSSSCFHNVSNSYHRSSQSFSYFIQHLPIRGFCVLQENFFMATEAYGWSLLHFIDFLPEARISTQKTLLSTILKLILETWSVGMKRRRLIEQIPGKFENPVASLRTKQDRQINSPGLGNNQQLKAGLFYYRSFLPGRQPRILSVGQPLNRNGNKLQLLDIRLVFLIKHPHDTGFYHGEAGIGKTSFSQQFFHRPGFAVVIAHRHLPLDAPSGTGAGNRRRLLPPKAGWAVRE